MSIFKNKKDSTNYSDITFRQAFVQQTQDASDLLHKELLVNQAEQTILKERIQVTKSFMNHLSASDPQYGILAVHIRMDQIELDELKTRELLIQQQFFF